MAKFYDAVYSFERVGGYQFVKLYISMFEKWLESPQWLLAVSKPEVRMRVTSAWGQEFSFAREADHSPPICVESVSSAVLTYQHLPCDCEWKSNNSEGVFRQSYADAWPRDHGWGHDVEMAGDEFLRWRVESKDEV